MEKGMLNIGGGGKQYDLPAMASGDTQVPMQMWKNMFTRYHDYTLRFTMGCIMRINAKGELKDTASYRQIVSLKVKKDQFVEMSFTPSFSNEKWNMYFKLRDDLQKFVKEMSQRKYDAETDLNVSLEPGVDRFNYEPKKSAEAVRSQYNTARNKTKAKKTGVSKLADDQAEQDAFMADIMADLDVIGNVNTDINKNLREHTKRLELQHD